MPPLDLYTRVRTSRTLHTRPRVQRAPSFPCALCFQGARKICKPRAYHATRTRTHAWSTVIASEAKQSISRHNDYGLLRRFAPRNDGRGCLTIEWEMSAAFFLLPLWEKVA